MKGRVVKWIDGRGFGFLRADEGGRDFFVHASAIVDDAPYKTLVEGEPVEFELKPAATGGRPVAVYVVRLDPKEIT